MRSALSGMDGCRKELPDKAKGCARGPVSRVLSPAVCGVAVISLGRRLPVASSGLPAGIRRGAAPAPRQAPRPLLGLAPGGGCHAPERCRPAGGLLPHRFTLASWTPGRTRADRRSVFCGPVHGSPRPGVTRHPAPLEPGLSSGRVSPARDRPAFWHSPDLILSQIPDGASPPVALSSCQLGI